MTAIEKYYAALEADHVLEQHQLFVNQTAYDKKRKYNNQLGLIALFVVLAAAAIIAAGVEEISAFVGCGTPLSLLVLIGWMSGMPKQQKLHSITKHEDAYIAEHYPDYDKNGYLAADSWEHIQQWMEWFNSRHEDALEINVVVDAYENCKLFCPAGINPHTNVEYMTKGCGLLLDRQGSRIIHHTQTERWPDDAEAHNKSAIEAYTARAAAKDQAQNGWKTYPTFRGTNSVRAVNDPRSSKQAIPPSKPTRIRGWQSLREQCFKLWGHRCVKCSWTPGRNEQHLLHVDHIKPKSKYPHLAEDINNLQPLCHSCNTSKGNNEEIDYRPKKLA